MVKNLSSSFKPLNGTHQKLRIKIKSTASLFLFDEHLFPSSNTYDQFQQCQHNNCKLSNNFCLVKHMPSPAYGLQLCLFIYEMKDKVAVQSLFFEFLKFFPFILWSLLTETLHTTLPMAILFNSKKKLFVFYFVFQSFQSFGRNDADNVQT